MTIQVHVRISLYSFGVSVQIALLIATKDG